MEQPRAQNPTASDHTLAEPSKLWMMAALVRQGPWGHTSRGDPGLGPTNELPCGLKSELKPCFRSEGQCREKRWHAPSAREAQCHVLHSAAEHFPLRPNGAILWLRTLPYYCS